MNTHISSSYSVDISFTLTQTTTSRPTLKH